MLYLSHIEYKYNRSKMNNNNGIQWNKLWNFLNSKILKYYVKNLKNHKYSQNNFLPECEKG